MSHKFGITGFVELQKHIAKKYSEFDQLYWLKEYAILLNLWPFRTDNIIKYQSSVITFAKSPKKNVKQLYHESVFERYPHTLNERKLYRDQEIVQIMLDLLSAVAFLHKHKIMHRDLKPANILVSEKNRAVIIDFSHAHLMYAPLDVLDRQVVTYYYRSPEVFEYQKKKETPYNESLDVWSIGMILIELITNQPFAEFYLDKVDDLDGERAYAALLSDPKRAFNRIKEFYTLKKRNFVYVNTYWQWITKMLANNPADRITAEEMFNTVQKFAQEYHVPHILPVNGELQCKLEDYPKVETKVDDVLYGVCLQLLNSMRIEYAMIFDVARFTDVIKYMISEGDITMTNAVDMIPALAIIIETVIFDAVTDFDSYGKYDITLVKNAIVNILQKYDGKLFSINRIFEYETEIEKLSKTCSNLELSS